MAQTYFAHITATNFEELLTTITTARHDGLEPGVELIEDSYFLEHVRNTVGVYRDLDYVPWRDVRWIAFIEIDVKAIALEDRGKVVRYSAEIGLKGDRIKPSHITENVYIMAVKHCLNSI